MFEGKVIWFNNDKGYGFIQFEDKEVFVHYSSILDDSYKTLIQDEKVIFDLRQTDKGLRAVNVKSLSKIESKWKNDKFYHIWRWRQNE